MTARAADGSRSVGTHRQAAVRRARSRAVRQLPPPRADDALPRQRHRIRVGAAASARAARRLSLRVHAHLSRDGLRRPELPRVRRRRAVAVARRAGGAAARRDQPRRLRGADPQGRVPARDRRATRRSRRRSSLQFAGYLAVLAVLRISGEPIHLEAWCSRCRCGSCCLSASPDSRSSSQRCRCSSRRRARADAAADDPDVPDADPLSADARSRGAAVVGCRESVRLARQAVCATRCSMAGSRSSRPTRWRSPSRSRCSSAAAGCFAGCRRISRISSETRSVRGSACNEAEV